MTTDKAQITLWVDPWIKKVLRRVAYETERSTSKVIADLLAEQYSDAPENPQREKESTRSKRR